MIMNLFQFKRLIKKFVAIGKQGEKMFNLIKRETKVIPNRSITLTGSDGEIEIPIRKSSANTSVIRSPKKNIVINKENHQVDAYGLIRIIRNLTQQIGAYKNSDNVYSAYAKDSLRTMRNNVASDLSKHFGIHWSLDANGNSEFWIG